jgi:hypothetical protein
MTKLPKYFRRWSTPLNFDLVCLLSK